MSSERLSGDTTIVAIGDSAMWGSGTDYRFKPPNLVHKLLNNGTPIPPVQLRARGGAVIGRTESTKSGIEGRYAPDRGFDDYGYSKPTGAVDPPDKWQELNDEALNNSSVDEKDINNLKWTIRRDMGDAGPTHLQQLEQFQSPNELLDVPFSHDYIDEPQPIRFYRDTSFPDPQSPTTGNAFTHVPHQIPPDAEDVDLVLVNGGSNDIGLEYMMNITNHTYTGLMRRIELHCYEDMKHLLEKTRDRFPNAFIVCLGYPIFLSEWTSYGMARQFLQSFLTTSIVNDKYLSTVPGHIYIERMVDAGMVFARAHQHYMRKAVAETAHQEARQGHPGVMYVSRGFGAIHALAGPDTWAWNLGDDDTFERRKHFLKEILGIPQDPPAPKDLYASIGHPNRKGSIETAKAILHRYNDRRSLSVREEAVQLGDSIPSVGGNSQSLKEALGSYRLHPNSFGEFDKGSVANALSHRYVDSIQVKFYRGTEFRHAGGWEKKWRTKHLAAGVDLFLDITPGRSGKGETFRVDWESDKNAKDTPQFDRHSDNPGRDRDLDPDDDLVVTEINIDPMAGRQMNGTVGTNYGKDRSENEDNVYGTDGDTVPNISWTSTDHGPDNDLPNNRDDFRPENRWDTERLKLGRLNSVSLRAKNPGFWTLRWIELTINGELTWITSETQHGDLEKTFKTATEKNWPHLSIPLLE